MLSFSRVLVSSQQMGVATHDLVKGLHSIQSHQRSAVGFPLLRAGLLCRTRESLAPALALRTCRPPIHHGPLARHSKSITVAAGPLPHPPSPAPGGTTAGLGGGWRASSPATIPWSKGPSQGGCQLRARQQRSGTCGTIAEKEKTWTLLRWSRRWRWRPVALWQRRCDVIIASLRW